MLFQILACLPDAFGQSDYIQPDEQTVRTGKILSATRLWQYHERVVFAEGAKANATYYPDSIWGYQKRGVGRFVSRTLPDSSVHAGQRYFLEVLGQNDYTVFLRRDKSGTDHYFLEAPDQPLRAISSTELHFALRRYHADCPAAQQDLRKLKQTPKQWKRFMSNYRECEVKGPVSSDHFVNKRRDYRSGRIGKPAFSVGGGLSSVRLREGQLLIANGENIRPEDRHAMLLLWGEADLPVGRRWLSMFLRGQYGTGEVVHNYLASNGPGGTLFGTYQMFGGDIGVRMNGGFGDRFRLVLDISGSYLRGELKDPTNWWFARRGFELIETELRTDEPIVENYPGFGAGAEFAVVLKPIAIRLRAETTTYGFIQANNYFQSLGFRTLRLGIQF